MAKKRKSSSAEDVKPTGEATPINPGPSPVSSLPEATVISVDEHAAVEAAMAVAGEAVQAASDPEWQSTVPVEQAPQAATAVAPVGRGRPSIYTDELAADICTRLSLGESLRSICKDDAMPAMNTIMGWAFRRPDFMEQYRAAREIQSEVMADEIKDIADDSSNDYMERLNKNGEFIGWMENGDSVRRAALRINTRQWIAGRMQPKRWGEQKQLTVQNPDGTAIGQPIDPRTLSPEAREALTEALRAAMRIGAVEATYEEDGA